MKTNRRVLVVDDEIVITEGLSALLDCESIESASASSCVGAVEILGTAFYPVIIADLCLNTREEGLELIEHIRQSCPASRVVVMSGYMTPEVEQDLLDGGVAFVFHKPASSKVILEAVEALLAEIEREASQAELSLEELYLSARKRLYDLSRRRFNLSHDRAEDVLQEAWMLFLEKRGLIRCAPSWLAGTVVNLSRQTLDRKKRKRETPAEECGLEEMAALHGGDLADRLALRQALGRVDERARTLCTLIAVEGLSYEEVSAATGLPIGSIGPMYIRAKEKVRKALSH